MTLAEFVKAVQVVKRSVNGTMSFDLSSHGDLFLHLRWKIKGKNFGVDHVLCSRYFDEGEDAVIQPLVRMIEGLQND